MNKELVYNNIYNMINNGFYLNQYIKMTEDINLSTIDSSIYKDIVSHLEEVSANIFNAILIGCQLFDDEEEIMKFVDMASLSLDSMSLSIILRDFNISEEEACERLKYGFGVHFTTPKICEEIIKNGKLIGNGKNGMFTKEEDEIINNAANEQRQNNPVAEKNLNYLYRGWGTGVSSYGSITNYFWMYHTPESLTFLFGDISKRDKESSMKFVLDNISHLSEENKKIVFNTMSNIWDRLVGDEQEVGCVLIDRDAFEYEVDYYYRDGNSIPVQRRPYSNNRLNGIDLNDNIINNDIDVKYLKFLKIPTIYKLEEMKYEKLNNKVL